MDDDLQLLRYKLIHFKNYSKILKDIHHKCLLLNNSYVHINNIDLSNMFTIKIHNKRSFPDNKIYTWHYMAIPVENALSLKVQQAGHP